MPNIQNSAFSKRSAIQALVAASLLSPEQIRAATAPSLKDMDKKWGEFSNHSLLYQTVYEAYRFVGRLVTAREFTSAISEFYQSENAVKEFNLAMNHKDNAFFFMDVGNKAVQTKMDFPDIKLNLNFSNDAQREMDGETIIKSLFPAFKIPTKWERQTVSVDLGNGRTTQRQNLSIGEDLVAVIPVEQFARMKTKFTSSNDKMSKTDAGFELDPKFLKNNFGKIANLKLTLKQSDVILAGSSKGDTGELRSGENWPIINLEIEAEFNWPLEFVYYVTCSANSSDFIPFLFFQYVTWHRLVYGSNRTRGGGMMQRPSRLNHLGNIVAKNAAEQRDGRNPKIRTNSDGFLILGVGDPAETGTVVHIDRAANNVDAYLQQIKSTYDGAQKRIDLSKAKIKGQALFSDPFQEKFTYIRETGIGTDSSDISGVQTVDLTGSVPLDNATIYKKLSAKLFDEEDGDLNEYNWFMSLVQKFIQGDFKGAKLSRDYLSADYLKSVGVSNNTLTDIHTMFGWVKAQLLRFGTTMTWANIGGVPLLGQDREGSDLSEAKSPKTFAQTRGALNILRDWSADMLKQIDQIGVGYYNRITRLQFLLFCITNYSKKFDAIQTETNTRINNNTVKNISDTAFESYAQNLVMPNLPGVTKLLPHQVETFYNSEDEIEAILNETGTGGGKSLLNLRDMANLLYKGNINRPLVICPGNLVRNWVNEILKFSQGKINVFALTIQSLRRLQYTYTKNPDPTAKPDYKMLKSIIESMPKNTVFVCSDRFLMNDREDVVYGNKVITRLYIAEFMRDIGFDFVGKDESQTAKNLGAITTLGIAIVMSAAKYKRELSGTAVNDTLNDLVGQAGIMLPQALGSLSRFQGHYGALEDEEGSGEWLPDAPQRITHDLKPFIKRIVNKREKWAVMLPELHEEFHSVDMTERQREYSDALLNRAFDELKRKNPRLAAKMIDGNESDAGAIEVGLGLNTHFQAIEQFIYAPDSDEAFTNLEGLKPEDLISPKVKMVVEILDKHFGGYTDTLGHKFAADPHKVIIFSHRTKTSLHMIKHLPEKYRSQAVHYAAGDFKALQSFLKDPKITILVADEISINVGQNFQLASRMIRLETLWAPGNQEQATARIWRPAFGEGSTRQQVFLDWIFTNKSLEVCKIARLISKIITKSRYDQQDNPSYTSAKFTPDKRYLDVFGQLVPQASTPQPINEMLRELQLVKMTTENMLNFNDVQQLYEYFAYYALLQRWDVQEYNRMKKEPRYTKLVDLPKSAYVEIPNSKSIPYTPRVPGVEPENFDPNNKMDFKPISVIENDMESSPNDEEERVVEINPVQIDQLVNTEFGFGDITKILQNDVWVDVKGIGEVRVPKATAWVIGNKQAEADLIRRLAKLGDVGDPKLPVVVLNAIKSNPIKAPVRGRPAREMDWSEEEEETQDRYNTAPGRKEPKISFDEYDEDEEEEANLPILAQIIDTQIALVTDSDSQTQFLVTDRGWRTIPAYRGIHIPNIAAFDKVLTALQGSFKIHSKYVENLEFYRVAVRNKSLNVVKTNAINQTMRFFNVDEHTKVKEGFIRPYPVIWNGNFYLVFDKNSPTTMAATRKIKALNLSGVSVIDQPALHVKFFGNKDEALAELGALHKKTHNSEYSESVLFLKKITTKADPQQNIKIAQIEKKQTTPPVKVQPVKQIPKPVIKQVGKATIKHEEKPKTSFTLNLKGLGKQR